MPDPDRPLWAPRPQRIAAANLTRFMRYVQERYGVAAADYAALYDWSIRDSERFWHAVWAFCDVIAATLQGRLSRPVPLGVVTHVETRIEVRVGTRKAVGFEPPRTQLGQMIFDVCKTPSERCTLVYPKPLDPQTGYVNAVGTILARALVGIAAESFAPVGEAIFSELPADVALIAGD